MRANEVAELLPYLTDPERAELELLLAADDALWRPQPGPQAEAYHSKADITGYGGAAGGGKTDLMCGTALTMHRRAMILRRVGTELTAIEDRFEELLGGREGYNGTKMIWRTRRGDLPLQIEFGAVPNAGDEKKFQGRPHDFLGFDEATNFLESQVRFLLGWLRTTTPGQRCRALLTFNPPTTAEGRWVISFFGPWLDPTHPNPASPGELRWFAQVAGKDVERPNGEPFEHDGETIQPLSRTFITSRVTDNPFFGQDYKAMLQGLPEPLRSQMLKGDFTAGMEDDAWQVIPTAWIDAAQARWKPRDAKGQMDSLGVDVARGGRDETIISPRYGTWFDQLKAFPGTETPDGPTVAGQVMVARRDRAPVHIDIIGWGSSPYDFLVQNDVQTVGVNGSSSAKGRTVGTDLGFINLRAELWWRMREALDPEAAEPIALPPDPGLKSDLAAPRWKLAKAGIQVEAKEDIVRRLGRSPDKGDAAVMALISTRKRERPGTHGRALAIPNIGAA